MELSESVAYLYLVCFCLMWYLMKTEGAPLGYQRQENSRWVMKLAPAAGGTAGKGVRPLAFESGMRW